MRTSSSSSALLAFLMLITLPCAAFAAPFSLAVNGVPDNGLLTRANGYDKVASDGSGRPCGGANIAPGFTWSNAPAAAQSFAILIFDNDGRNGLGVSHWVAYNIPGKTTALGTADIAAATTYTTGRGTGDLVRSTTAVMRFPTLAP